MRWILDLIKWMKGRQTGWIKGWNSRSYISKKTYLVESIQYFRLGLSDCVTVQQGDIGWRFIFLAHRNLQRLQNKTTKRASLMLYGLCQKQIIF